MIRLIANLLGVSTPVVIGGVVVALIGALGAGLHLIRADARANLETEIKEQNDEATIDAFRADLGYLDCIDGGFVYDFRASECRSGAAGGR